MNVVPTPVLQNFLITYLHQDFDLQYGSMWAAVDAFIADEPDAARITTEIALVLETFASEGAAEAYLDELGCEYAADWDGSTYRGWLEEVSRRVTTALG